MNLIEQLGGYARAIKMSKERESSIDGDIPLDTMMYSYDFGIFSWGDLQSALLEHRRQHGIFEVGDKVVLISNSDDDIFEYTEYSKNLDLHFFESKNNYGHASLSNIRHATDAEIEAGHRL